VCGHDPQSSTLSGHFRDLSRLLECVMGHETKFRPWLGELYDFFSTTTSVSLIATCTILKLSLKQATSEKIRISDSYMKEKALEDWLWTPKSNVSGRAAKFMSGVTTPLLPFAALLMPFIVPPLTPLTPLTPLPLTPLTPEEEVKEKLLLLGIVELLRKLNPLS